MPINCHIGDRKALRKHTCIQQQSRDFRGLNNSVHLSVNHAETGFACCAERIIRPFKRLTLYCNAVKHETSNVEAYNMHVACSTCKCSVQCVLYFIAVVIYLLLQIWSALGLNFGPLCIQIRCLQFTWLNWWRRRRCFALSARWWIDSRASRRREFSSTSFDDICRTWSHSCSASARSHKSHRSVAN